MKTKKKKVLIANDSSFIKSGYGIYGKELLSRLHDSGRYEVAELGCYAHINSQEIKNIPWKFYPNAVESTDPRYSTYKENNINQFGLWRFNRTLLDFKPDIVFDIRDYWMYSYQEVSPLRKYFNWIIMPTVDSHPQKKEWLHTFANADMIIPYTEWAKKCLITLSSSKINLYDKIANAGINPNEFFPLPSKSAQKKKLLGQNCNVIGAVMRNQKRKLIAELLLSFRKYLDYLKINNTKEYEKSFLYLHTSYPEDGGWDLPGLLSEYGVMDKVYFTYICRNCKKFHCSKFQGAIKICPSCKEYTSSFCNVSHGIETEQLNQIYNLFDLFVQYAICEGFGMPQIEAAACGVKVAAVDYSAMSEIVRNIEGIPIKISKKFREMETNADRVYPDNDHLVEILKSFFNKSKLEIEQESKLIREKCISYYTWDNVYAVWDECFQSMENPKLSWDNNIISETYHENMNVPPNLNPRDFVKYICYKIINDPYLFSTAPIQKLVKNLHDKIVCDHGIVKTFSHSDAVKILEGHLNNKIISEKLRTNPQLLKNEDYLQCRQ